MPGIGIGPGTVFRQDLFANRPAPEPAMQGFFFYATDTGSLYQCDGTSWIKIAGTLPVATGSLLGGVKIGANISELPDGTISVAAPYALPVATSSTLGGVKAGSGLSVDGGGNLKVTTLDALTFVINGSAQVIPMGIVGDLLVPYSCTISQVTLLADTSTTTIIDIWKAGYASYPPVLGNTITASDKPTITAGIKSQDSALTGWTLAIAAGDILRFNVNSNSAATLVTVALSVSRT